MNRKKKKAISKSQIIYDVASTPYGMFGDGFDLGKVFELFDKSGILLYDSRDQEGNPTTHKPQIIPHSKRVRIQDIQAKDFNIEDYESNI